MGVAHSVGDSWQPYVAAKFIAMVRGVSAEVAVVTYHGENVAGGVG